MRLQKYWGLGYRGAGWLLGELLEGFVILQTSHSALHLGTLRQQPLRPYPFPPPALPSVAQLPGRKSKQTQASRFFFPGDLSM